MNNLEQRITDLESRVEAAFAIDARFKALDSEVGKLNAPPKRPLREWLGALGPFASSLALLFVGYWINDSVKSALDREQLDLDYVKDMRDVIKDFDQATTQPVADANAIGLAMYGKHAILPLIEGLDGGDVANLAAVKGLLLIGSNDPAAACPKFTAVINDTTRRYSWQSHKAILKIMGQSVCVKNIQDIDGYQNRLTHVGTDPASLAKFGQRYSDPDAFDAESVAGLRQEAVAALGLLQASEHP